MRRVLSSLLVAVFAILTLPGTAPGETVEPGWLTALNHLRQQGGLDRVVEVRRLSEDALLHARYAVANDVRGHTQDPTLPGATDQGRVAAEQSNLVYHTGPLTPVDSIWYWMGSISHLAWMVNPELDHTGMGLYHRPDDADLQTVGVLNVVDGISPDRQSTSHVWPVDGAVVPLGQHGSCPHGIASFVVTAEADDTVDVTAAAVDGHALEIVRTDGLAAAATGFTTCDVAPGASVTWTTRIAGEPETDHRVTYADRADLPSWPVDPPLEGEVAIPNDASTPAPAFALDRRDAGSPATLAVELAAEVFPGRGDARFAVLSRDDDFADSLAGSALARFGPVLFTPTQELRADVAAWLTEGLEPGSAVYLLGGDAALGPDVETAVSALGFRPVRLAGPTRTVTAVVVAEEAMAVAAAHFADAHPELYGSSEEWVGGRFNLARAGNWADAIAVAPYAAGLTRAGGGCCIAPVTLLTPKDSLDAGVRDFVADTSLHLATVLGGEAAVAEHVPAGLDITSLDRHAGSNRAATAVEIGANLLDLGAEGDQTGILLIDGDREDGWAWGLAATSYAFHNDMAILMVRGGTLPPSTLSAVQHCVPVEVLGDTDIIPAAVEHQVAARPC